jgi:hypothetical protein
VSGPSPNYRLDNHGGNESDEDAGHEDGPAVDKVDHDSLGINYCELERLGRPWKDVKNGPNGANGNCALDQNITRILTSRFSHALFSVAG